MDWGKCVNSGAASLQCIPAVFKNIITAALLFAGVAALFFIIFSGIKFILSRGDAKKVQSARETLTYAIIGLIVILLSFLIVNIISYITGVGCIKFFGFGNCQ